MAGSQPVYAPQAQNENDVRNDAQPLAPPSRQHQSAVTGLHATAKQGIEGPPEGTLQADRREVIDLEDEGNVKHRSKNVGSDDCAAGRTKKERDRLGRNPVQMDEGQLPIWNDEFDVLTW